MDHWYFAYGSNLLREQMITRTGSPRFGDEPPRIARLPGYRLAFNLSGGDGQLYANIVQPGEGVIGVIYRARDEALRKLDAYESGYTRREVIVADETGNELHAIAYIGLPENVSAEGPPSTAYLQRITTGAREYGLPADYIAAIETLAVR